jgi:hypothetical protein
LDSCDIYAFERPFGGRDKINPLRLYVPGRMFLMKATGTMIEDLVAIPEFLLSHRKPKEFAAFSFVPNKALALERLRTPCLLIPHLYRETYRRRS